MEEETAALEEAKDRAGELQKQLAAKENIPKVFEDASTATEKFGKRVNILLDKISLAWIM